MGNTTVVLFSVMRPEYPDDCSLPSAAPLDSPVPGGSHLLTLWVLLWCPFLIFRPSPGKSVHAQGVRVPEPRLLPLLVLDPFC